MHEFIFTAAAKRSFLALEEKIQERIRAKLLELKAADTLAHMLKPLQGIKPVHYRLRVGNYRLILRPLEHKSFAVIDLGHRRDIYR